VQDTLEAYLSGSQQQHFFTADPAVPSNRRSVTLALKDLTVKLDTDSGVFSADRVDRGTEILLESVPEAPASGELLDLGCGYGPIAVALAVRRPRARVWAVDVNNRALDLTRDNAARAGLTNVTTVRPEQVPEDLEFRAIYSNPPIHVGKAALHELLLTWLPRLAPGGAAYLVVQKNLGSDSLATWLRAQGYPTSRLTSHLGYRILHVEPATPQQ
jgi:16S rRNA G1207 methylase RsmC